MSRAVCLGPCCDIGSAQISAWLSLFLTFSFYLIYQMVDHQTAPPILEAPQQPVASKSLSRSKTMRNTANKVSRFFKKQAAVKEVSTEQQQQQQQQHPRSLSSTTSSSQHGWDRASIPSTFMDHSVNDVSLAPRPVSSYYHGETTSKFIIS